jgi:hypothetical protein
VGNSVDLSDGAQEICHALWTRIPFGNKTEDVAIVSSAVVLPSAKHAGLEMPWIERSLRGQSSL